MSTHDEHWERFLNPDIVRAELSSASMYITTFEILKDSIVNRIRDFYTNDFNVSDFIVDKKIPNRGSFP